MKKCITISEIDHTLIKIVANFIIWKPFLYSVAPSHAIEKALYQPMQSQKALVKKNRSNNKMS